MAALHGCRWEWCRNTFDTHNDLVDHMKTEHLLSMRPMSKRNAADMLRIEGYTPEEIASRLIPGYVPTTQPAPLDDPPHQAPESSPPTQEQSQLTLISETSSRKENATEQTAVIPATQSPPPVTPPPVDHPDQTIDDDGDILMPSSSPPPESPTPSPERPSVNDMPINEPEHDSPQPPTDFLVPVSSPPPTANGRASSVGSRTPRLKRRSSFSQMSSSPPADEFTAPRYEPLPASPSTAKMIAEREKGLKAKETEDRGPAHEKENNKDRHNASRGRGSPPALQKPSSQPSGTANAMVSGGRGMKLRRGLVRGRGQSGLQILTPGRQPPPSASRRMSPGLRIESRSNPSELHTFKPISQEFSAAPQTPPRAKQSTIEATPTAEQMISRYTHAESDSDEDILDDLKANLEDPDSGLQTQAPYVSQT